MDQDQQRYERARKRVEAFKGFYIHATVFVLVNIALFIINVLTGGAWWFRLATSRLRHRLGGACPRGVRFRRRWTFGTGLGGAQDPRIYGRRAKAVVCRCRIRVFGLLAVPTSSGER